MTDPYGGGQGGRNASGQPAPQQQGYGQQGAWGQPAMQGQGIGAYGAPGPYGGSGAYGPPPVKRRGMVRIILGILAILGGILGAVIGLFLGSILGGAIGMLASIGDIPPEDITTISNGQSVDVRPDGILFVGTTDPAMTCTASGSDVESTSQSGGITFEKDGRTYSVVTQVTSVSGASATISCVGDGEIAVVDLGLESTLGGLGIGLLIGVGLPTLLGILGLILLISGITGRIRSGRGQ